MWVRKVSALAGAAFSRAAPILVTWTMAFLGEVHTCGSKRNSGSLWPSSGGKGQAATSTLLVPRSTL